MRPGLLRLALVHLFGIAAVLWLGYDWLGIAESRAATLAWSVAVALLAAALAMWLYGGAFLWFAAPKLGVRRAFTAAARRLPALLLFAAVAVLLYIGLGRLHDLSRGPSFRVASYLTLKLRTPVRPTMVAGIVSGAFFVLCWAVVPVLVTPVFSAVARLGWRGFGHLRPLRPLRYWIAIPFLALCAYWLPLRLLSWVPRMPGFGMEMASFVVRAAVAYCLFVAAPLAIAFLTSAGSPLFTHSRTDRSV